MGVGVGASNKLNENKINSSRMTREGGAKNQYEGLILMSQAERQQEIDILRYGNFPLFYDDSSERIKLMFF